MHIYAKGIIKSNKTKLIFNTDMYIEGLFLHWYIPPPLFRRKGLRGYEGLYSPPVHMYVKTLLFHNLNILFNYSLSNHLSLSMTKFIQYFRYLSIFPPNLLDT